MLPRIEAGFAAGYGDPAGFTAFFSSVDKNGDGVLCVKTTPAAGSNGNVQGFHPYTYSFVDDNSSALTG